MPSHLVRLAYVTLLLSLFHQRNSVAFQGGRTFRIFPTTSSNTRAVQQPSNKFRRQSILQEGYVRGRGSMTSMVGELVLKQMPASFVALAVALPVVTLSIIVRKARRRAARSHAVETSFRGKVVWVTGASSGIGRSIALAFAKQGAKLVLSARRQEELHNVASECAAAASSSSSSTLSVESVAKVLPFDLAEDPKKLQTKGIEAAALWGADAVDILVNNGGISSRSAAELTDLDVDQRVMAIDYLAPVALTKGVLPAMLARGEKVAGADTGGRKPWKEATVGRSGHVVVVSSVQGKLAIPFRTSYAAAKHALHGFFESLRAEVAARDVKVTMVCPGYVKTNLSLNAVTGSGKIYSKMDENTAKGMEPAVLAKKILEAVAIGEHEVMACDFKTKAAIFARTLLPGPLASYMVSRAKKGWKDQRSSGK